MKTKKKELLARFAYRNCMKTINQTRALESFLHALIHFILNAFSYGSKKQTLARFAERRYEAIHKHE